MEPLFTMIIFGTLILFGFLSAYLFTRTKIPDSLILMLSGALLAKLGIVDPSSFTPFMGLMASVALAIILFDAGMGMDVESIVEKLTSAFYLGLFGFFLTSFILAGIFHYLLQLPLIFALLLGFSVGGSSAAIVIPMAASLNMENGKLALLSLESTITNVLEVVFGLSVAQLILRVNSDWRSALSIIFSSFSTGIVLGVIAALLWIRLLKKARGKPYSYMITLGALFILYGLTEMVGGSGALASLTFGFILGNSREITRLLHLPQVPATRFAQFHEEISFLVRTYFFLFIGTVLPVPTNTLFWGVAILAAAGIILGRIISLKALDLDMELLPFIPRGLNEAVLGVIYTTMGLPYSGDIFLIISLIIILTNILSAPLLKWMVKEKTKEEKEKEKRGK